MILLQIIGFASLAHIVVDFIEYLDISWIPEKPFKCDLCMGFWISVVPLTIEYGMVGVLLAAISGVCANIIYKYI